MIALAFERCMRARNESIASKDDIALRPTDLHSVFVEAINRSLRKSPDDHAQIAPALALFPADERRIFFRTALQYLLRLRTMAIIEQFFANSKRIAIVYSRRCIA